MPSTTKEPVFQRGGLIRLVVAVVCFVSMYHAFHWLSANLWH